MPFPREDYRDRANRRADLHTEGVKGMFILNGGGTLALLTSLTQIIKEPALFPIAKYIVGAIAFWSVGLVALAPINHLRYETSRLYDQETTKARGEKYGMAHRGLFCASVLCFAIGLSFALAGAWRLSNVQLPNKSDTNKAAPADNLKSRKTPVDSSTFKQWPVQ